MLYIILSIVIGIAVGVFVPSQALLQRLIQTMRPLVLLLLFVMGIHLGTDDTVWTQLTTFGWSAMIIAVFSVAGSIAAAGLYRFVAERKSGDEA